MYVHGTKEKSVEVPARRPSLRSLFGFDAESVLFDRNGSKWNSYWRVKVVVNLSRGTVKLTHEINESDSNVFGTDLRMSYDSAMKEAEKIYDGLESVTKKEPKIESNERG